MICVKHAYRMLVLLWTVDPALLTIQMMVQELPS